MSHRNGTINKENKEERNKTKKAWKEARKVKIDRRGSFTDNER